jgi:hypothetical protein
LMLNWIRIALPRTSTPVPFRPMKASLKTSQRQSEGSLLHHGVLRFQGL